MPDHGTATGAGVPECTLKQCEREDHELCLQEVVLLEKTMELHKPE